VGRSYSSNSRTLDAGKQEIRTHEMPERRPIYKALAKGGKIDSNAEGGIDGGGGEQALSGRDIDALVRGSCRGTGREKNDSGNAYQGKGGGRGRKETIKEA